VSKSIGVNKTIPDAGKAIESTYYQPHEVLLEHVQVTVQIAHKTSSDLKVTLTSPSGTVSVLSDNHGFGKFAE
jgi:subtilisin-like proprotein convertase family protein